MLIIFWKGQHGGHGFTTNLGSSTTPLYFLFVNRKLLISKRSPNIAILAITSFGMPLKVGVTQFIITTLLCSAVDFFRLLLLLVSTGIVLHKLILKRYVSEIILYAPLTDNSFPILSTDGECIPCWSVVIDCCRCLLCFLHAVFSSLIVVSCGLVVSWSLAEAKYLCDPPSTFAPRRPAPELQIWEWPTLGVLLYPVL